MPAALLLLSVLSGCDWPLGSDDYRDRLAEVARVTAPDTVSVGNSFDVVVTSFRQEWLLEEG